LAATGTEKIDKMREVNLSQNSTGFPGVRRARNKWQARVTVNGRRLQSRGFDTKEEAAKWREAQIAHYQKLEVAA
jgi:hypothetical protein